MDVQTNAAVAAVYARLAGRLSDDVLDAVRDHYAAGETEIAESALLLGLALEGVAITLEEQDLIRATLDDPGNPDLDDVPIVDEAPPPPYRFHATAPATAPDPSRADEVLAAAVPTHGARRLCRAWREPLADAQDGATWLYVLVVDPETDVLSARGALASRLWWELQQRWLVEVVTEGEDLPPYQAKALTMAHEVLP
ncbi:hypothetical protein [Actinophytocola sp. NPDC049390]|uniref:hypothetical protein n=1 Tax=Actinophytocola sp. NPDC049390 TaxID=3363894 RepID=UPI0037BBC569